MTKNPESLKMINPNPNFSSKAMKATKILKLE